MKEDIQFKLYRFGKKQRLHSLFGNLSYLILLFLVLWLSVTLADHVFHFSKMTRWGLLAINIPLIGYLFYRRFLYL